MTAWDTLVQQAILGTTRQPLSPAAPDELAAFWPQPTPLDPETHFLQVAALLTQYHAAGRQPVVAPLATAIADCPTEASAPAPTGATALLRHLLVDGDHKLLIAWLRHATARTHYAPHDLLPALLDLAVKRHALAEALVPCLGERGRWLVQLNPAWQFAAATVIDAADWRSGRNEARQRFLQELRQRAPLEARALLESTWTQEPAHERADFLRVLRINLSIDDEPFLEQALTDRSQAVRTEATHLLAGLNGSRLQQTLLAQVATHVSIERKWLQRTLQVKLPTRFATNWAQLGLRKQSPLGVRIGEKAGWLVQLVALLPPSRLVAHLALDAVELLEFVRASDFAEALSMALLEGAELHQDHPFLLAELQHLQRLLALEQMSPSEWLDRFVRYAPLLPASVRDQVMQRYLETMRAAAFPDWTTLGTVVRTFDQLSPAVTATLLNAQIPALLQRTTRDYGIGRVLLDSGYLLAPAGYPTAMKLFALCPGDERPDYIAQFLRIYQLRYQMEKEFAA